MLKSLFRKRVQPDAAVPDGQRVYAIGDVHGRLDLLESMLAQIEADNRARGTAAVRLILLGDLIDRGPDSAGVIERAMRPFDWCSVTVLRGNHEATMLDALDGDMDMMRMWLRYGGDATLRSWGMDETILSEAALVEVIEEARRVVPTRVHKWLMTLPASVRIGGYLFVHAGVRPGVALDEQSLKDTLWIRDEFLQSTRDHGAIVVHGHSIGETVEERTNRIGLDTGAYATGRLTALALEGTERWYLNT